MGHKGRGKEGMVRCEKCGRLTRRDKAVYIEKPMLTNPLERHQVEEPDSYRRAIFREVCYCISCGKHGRIFEKKKQQNERLRERERLSGYGRRSPYPGERRETRPYGTRPAAQSTGQSKPADSAQAQPSAAAEQAVSQPVAEDAASKPVEESEVPEESQGEGSQ